MTLIFFGSDPWFSPPVLEALVKAGHNVSLLITKADEVSDGLRTTDYGKRIICIQAKTQGDISKSRLQKAVVGRLSAVSDDRPSAIVLAAFGPPFLPNDLLDWPTYGALNVHASLLPRWRGASPVSAAIAAGDKETGVTIMKMTKEIDRGSILGQARIAIHQPIVERSDLGVRQGRTFSGKFDTRESLTRRLGALGGELIVKTIGQISQIRPIGQPPHSPTPYTYRLKKEDGRIDWSKSAEEIERFIRAVTPWPGATAVARIKAKGKRTKEISLKILRAHLDFLHPSSHSGLSPSGRSDSAESSDSKRSKTFDLRPFLVIDEVQLPGKNPITWKQFLAGHPGAELN